MSYCTNCGFKFSEDANFCTECGEVNPDIVLSDEDVILILRNKCSFLFDKKKYSELSPSYWKNLESDTRSFLINKIIEYKEIRHDFETRFTIQISIKNKSVINFDELIFTCEFFDENGKLLAYDTYPIFMLYGNTQKYEKIKFKVPKNSKSYRYYISQCITEKSELFDVQYMG